MGSKDNVVKHLTVKGNVYSLRISAIIRRVDRCLKSQFLFSLMLITKQSLPLIVQTPTTVQITTVTLSKSSSYHTILQVSKNPIRYLDFVSSLSFSFHSVPELPDSVKELPKQLVKFIVMLFPAQTERITRRNHRRGPFCPSHCCEQLDRRGFVHRQPRDISEGCTFPCHCFSVFFLPSISARRQHGTVISALASSALVLQASHISVYCLCISVTQGDSMSTHHSVFGGEVYQLRHHPVTVLT